MTCATVQVIIVGVKKGMISRTFNVKPKTKDCSAGSGGAFSAKQEKLEVEVIQLHNLIT